MELNELELRAAALKEFEEYYGSAAYERFKPFRIGYSKGYLAALKQNELRIDGMRQGSKTTDGR